jgi:hypothetical protein
MFLDGIRYSLDMAGLAYTTLAQSLLQVSVGTAGDASAPTPTAVFPSCFMDAWSFVDSINRLRVLLSQMPNVKRTPLLRVFERHLEPFEELRNSVQHLPGEILAHADAGEPVWGSLSWVYWPNLSSEKSVFAHVMIAGSMNLMKAQPVVNPLARPFRTPIDHVELTAFQRTVPLTATYWQLSGFVRSIEATLEPQFEGLDRAGGDVLLTIEFTRRKRARPS